MTRLTRAELEILLNLFSRTANQSADRFSTFFGFLLFVFWFSLGFLNDLLCGGDWLFCEREVVLGSVLP